MSVALPIPLLHTTAPHGTPPPDHITPATSQSLKGVLMAINLHISLPENVAIVEFGPFVTEADYEETLQVYATHPDARHGQNFLCDMRRAADGTIDMAKRLALQVTLDQHLGAGPLPRTIVYLVSGTRMRDLVAPCATLWEPNAFVSGTITMSEAEAICLLGLKTRSIDALLPAKPTLDAT